MTTLIYLCILSMLVMLPLGFGLYYGSRLKAAIGHWRRELECPETAQIGTRCPHLPTRCGLAAAEGRPTRSLGPRAHPAPSGSKR